MNPTAIIFMLFGASAGYWTHDSLSGAAAGLAITSFIILTIDLWPNR